MAMGWVGLGLRLDALRSWVVRRRAFFGVWYRTKLDRRIMVYGEWGGTVCMLQVRAAQGSLGSERQSWFRYGSAAFAFSDIW